MAKYKVGDIVSYNSQKYQVCWCSSETSACNYCVFWDKSACFGHCKNCINIIGTHTYYKKLENMEQPKEIKIQVPEGMEIDRENSTFECIKFKPKKLTYDKIQKSFKRRGTSYKVYTHQAGCCEEHYPKLTVYCKLLEVADYLNDGWKFDNDNEEVGYIIHKVCNQLDIHCYQHTTYGIPVFKTAELAKQAIEIIGEEDLKTLF